MIGSSERLAFSPVKSIADSPPPRLAFVSERDGLGAAADSCLPEADRAAQVSKNTAYDENRRSDALLLTLDCHIWDRWSGPHVVMGDTVFDRRTHSWFPDINFQEYWYFLSSKIFQHWQDPCFFPQIVMSVCENHLSDIVYIYTYLSVAVQGQLENSNKLALAFPNVPM